MALWRCTACTTAYSVGAPRCPHCGATEHVEDGAMPKITKHQGATYEGHVDASPADVAEPTWTGKSEGLGTQTATDNPPQPVDEVKPKPATKRARTTRKAAS